MRQAQIQAQTTNNLSHPVKSSNPVFNSSHLGLNLNRKLTKEGAEVGRSTTVLTKAISKTIRATKVRTNQTKTIKGSPFKKAKRRQTNDYHRLPVGGRLVRFQKSWVKSFHFLLVAKGLRWNWINNVPPPLFQPSTHWRQETSLDMDLDLYKLYRK